MWLQDSRTVDQTAESDDVRLCAMHRSAKSQAPPNAVDFL